jgi:predicted nucleic acid-binding protein
MNNIRVFIDSDVVVSSLISTTGAAYLLLNQSEITPIISSISYQELEIVVKRMNIETQKLEKLVQKRFEFLKITKKPEVIKREYKNYVTDLNDAHIIAGAHAAKVKFLISYNLRHFKKDKIKENFDILLMTPALFLQYLRST